MHWPLMSKVYSYTRFSTPEQAQGDSQRRQTDMALKWAAARGLELDDRLSFSDLGVSAYRGSNTEDDRGLGTFLYACRNGLIERGSFLLVESLDRITRMVPRKAQRLFEDIVDAGVTIVTLNDGQEYTADRLDADPTALLISLLVAWRGHEESKTKGRRLAAAWAEKRRKVRAGETNWLTNRAPYWLHRTNGEWTIDPVHGTTVKRVFEMTLSGIGENKIAQTLNLEGVPVMGRGAMWHRSAIAKLLRNLSVIGHMIPGHMDFSGGKPRRVMEEPVPGVFPPVITEDHWLAVRALKDGSSASVRGRNAGRPLTNVLGGLAKCPDCGVAMTRVFKGTKSGGKPKLVCTKAKLGAANHPYVSVNCEEVERALLRHWGTLMAECPAGDRDAHLDRELQNLEGNLSALTDHLESLTVQLERNPSDALAGVVRKMELELRTMLELRSELEQRIAIADRGIIQTRLSELHTALTPDDEGPQPVDKARVNAALKTLFTGVTVDHHKGLLWFHWRQGGETGIMFRWADEAA